VVARQQSRGVKVRSLFPPEPYKDIDEWMLGCLAQAEAVQVKAVRR
jgi:hypothetical protein